MLWYGPMISLYYEYHQVSSIPVYEFDYIEEGDQLYVLLLWPEQHVHHVMLYNFIYIYM